MRRKRKCRQNAILGESFNLKVVCLVCFIIKLLIFSIVRKSYDICEYFEPISRKLCNPFITPFTALALRLVLIKIDTPKNCKQTSLQEVPKITLKVA